MAFTEAQIYSYLNRALKNSGFENITVGATNVDKIGLTNPTDINSMISSLNLILNNEFYTNVGEYSKIAKAFIKPKSTNNGLGTKIVKFHAPDLTTATGGGQFKNAQFHANTTPTLANLVSRETNLQKSLQSNFISTQNLRFNPYMNIDKREISKLYTVSGVTAYCNEVIDYLTKTFDMYLSFNLIDMLIKNQEKMVRFYYGTNFQIYQPINDAVILCSPSTIDYIAAASSLKSSSINKNIIANMDDMVALLHSATPHLYYTTFHFKPEIEFIFSRRSSATNTTVNQLQPAGFLLNRNSINIKLYNHQVSEFSSPNEPDNVNVYLNVDIEMSIDCSYPNIAYMSGAKPTT